MKLKKLKLNNIRSYVDGEINFPDGISLLSGNVGSGKSTILLAVEFALFGVQRGSIPGSSLLRNGCNSGFVNLSFEINNKNISIKRTLRRNSDVINQDSGYFTINDITQALTPTELRQRIFEIFNYPIDSFSKSSFIYKYTVYTPQEEMKFILSSNKETRLETLRKVFNIDKYKRIKDNCKLLLTEIRSRKREFAVYIADLEPKKDKIKELNLSVADSKMKIVSTSESLNILLKDIEEKKISLGAIENNIKDFNNLKKEFDVLSSQIKLKSENKLRFVKQIMDLKKSIEEFPVENNAIENIESIKKDLLDNNEIIASKNREVRDVIIKLSELKMSIRNSEEIKNKINSIDLCPLCEQKVNHEHKLDIFKREDEKILSIQKDADFYLIKESNIENELKKLKEFIDALRKKCNDAEINKLKYDEITIKKDQLNVLLLDIKTIDNDLLLLNNRIIVISEGIDKLKNIESAYKDSKNNLENLLEKKHNFEIEKISSERELKVFELQIGDLKKEIESKEKIRLKLQEYIEIQEWLEVFFINLMSIMERKIMLRIHNEFNSLFQNWFSMIMDTENIRVRLDEEFSPLIEQSGYDIDYDSLSGGERTACALAYRLALNQIINTVADYINTKDLIILDEPTEGFSSEQIEKVRDVLHELKMNQIIIVSHESKVESFVDSIIKIKKEGDISSIS